MVTRRDLIWFLNRKTVTVTDGGDEVNALGFHQ